MKKKNCTPQKISKYVLGSLLGIGAAGLILIGITILPFFGILLALPVIALALYIFQIRLNDACEITF